MTNNASNKQLFLATVAFTIAIALPVILGSVGRIPMGLLTDRYGGRLIFSALLIFGLIPPLALALNRSYPSLLFWGFWLGLSGSSFAVGIAFVSRWFPAQKQGTALGIYGVGNIGQSIAVFFGPVMANRIGIPSTLIVFGLVTLGWGLVFAIWSRNAERKAKPKTLQESVRVLYTEPLSWALSLFYFLTFGGFVALGIYLPTLLKDTFLLTAEDAGARTAGFIILATLARPLGGWLSDRIGGQRLLIYVFGGIIVCAWPLATASMIPFTIGALGCAALLGLGNGAVFKLVAQYFPMQVGTVTGLVGAAGGLGGFFPPIVLGTLKDTTGTYSMGFVLLSLFALGCWLVLSRTFLRVEQLPQAKPRRHYQK
jgi:NNP family nitrate/nitrite transporter-like MFS transporter